MKICVNCKHFSYSNFVPDDYCFSPKSIIEQDLVSGNYRRYTAKQMRSIPDRCGKEGIAFEKKVNLKDSTSEVKTVSPISFFRRILNVKPKS